jgi:hypothetical protein
LTHLSGGKTACLPHSGKSISGRFPADQPPNWIPGASTSRLIYELAIGLRWNRASRKRVIPSPLVLSLPRDSESAMIAIIPASPSLRTRPESVDLHGMYGPWNAYETMGLGILSRHDRRRAGCQPVATRIPQSANAPPSCLRLGDSFRSLGGGRPLHHDPGDLPSLPTHARNTRVLS